MSRFDPMRIDPAATIPESMVGATETPGSGLRADSRAADVIRTFDPASQRDWCELVRDVVAAANSGGGTIVVHGLANRWLPGSHSHAVKSLTSEALLQRFREFTGSSFANVVVQPVDRQEVHAIRIAVGPALMPIGFTKRGTYLEPSERAKEVDVFPAGSFYFRHGDRSEPATGADLRIFFERLLRRVRRQWLRGIRRLVGTPTETLLQSGRLRVDPLITSAPRQRTYLQPVRIVEDPNAPALQPQDVDRLYPYRLRDVVAELNRRADRHTLTTYDIQAVRRQHRLDERPDFVFHLVGAGRRYSPAMVDWLASEWQRDPEFFRAARAADQQVLRSRRRKPR
jgi:hypothetical protein